MKNKNEFVDMDLAEALLKKGFTESCEYMYADIYRVRDEISQRHPGLTGDAYLSLLKENGGPYQLAEIYGTYRESRRGWCRNTHSSLCFYPNMVCAMPSWGQVTAWLAATHGVKVAAGGGADGFQAAVRQRVLALPDVPLALD